MTIKLSDQSSASLAELRYQPVLKRVRVLAGQTTVADTTEPVLVWEPRRVVPSYAVPTKDLTADLARAATDTPSATIPVNAMGGGPPVLDPRTGFSVHTAPGEPLSVQIGSGPLVEAAAFRPNDPALDGYVILDFAAFDWLEEDEPIVSHPRDPYHRIDIRGSSRPVRIEHEGTVLADTVRAHFLFEGAFPFARYYMPRQDIKVDLVPSDFHTACAYKGHATHWSVDGSSDELKDIAWSYEEPLDDATAVKGLVAFYTERLDVWLDGIRQARRKTPWSRRDGS